MLASQGRINGMTYTSLSPPEPGSLPFVRPISIRRIAPLEQPLFNNITLPCLPTIRNHSGPPPETTAAETIQPFTFYTAASPKGVTYRLTTHLYPSAYPRSPFRFGSIPININQYERIGDEKEKDVRKKLFTDYMAILEEWAHGVSYGLEGGCETIENYESVCAAQRRVMWNSVNRLVRDELEKNIEPNRERLTLFLAHGIGYPKETWEPTIQSLLSQFEEPDSQTTGKLSPIVEEIWVFEAAQHGDTGLINAGLLPRAYDWLDNVRDILQFLLYYMPEWVERVSNGKPTILPTHLTRLPEITAIRRKQEGYDSRIMVAIGHSFGGTSVTRAAVEHPPLFSSLFLVDPAMRPAPAKYDRSNPATSHEIRLAGGALQRRNFWKSKEEARTSLSQLPHYKKWNPDVFNAYIQYGITEENGVARLKMSGLHEAILLLQVRATHEMWQLLPQLDRDISLFFVASGTSRIAFQDPDILHETVWRRPGNVTNVVLPVSHLIPHEAPIELASLIMGFLIKRYSSSNEKQLPRARL